MCSPGRPWRLLIILCLLGGLSPAEARAADAFERAMASVERLYNDFKYPQALEQLNRSRSVTRGVEDDATIYLYEGIILFELSKEEQARSKFLAALLLKPKAQLPLSVSPKVEAEFEAQRARVLEKLPGGDPTKEPSAPRVADTRDESSQKAQAEQSPSDRPERTSLRELPAPQTTASANPALQQPGPNRASRTVPFILLGAGVVAAGMGSGFGLSSRSQVDDARTAQFQSDVIAHQQQAQRSALAANLLFGTAGLAAAGALVSWLVLPPATAPEATVNP